LAATPPFSPRKCLVEAALEYHTEAVIGRGLVRAENPDERVAPGGGVGVEVLIGERVGAKAPADAQVDATAAAWLTGRMSDVISLIYTWMFPFPWIGPA
jgi:hypothetical protein